MSYSVLILTLNEELNIERCIASLKNCNDIVILDSFSSDNTLNLANKYDNVRVYKRDFDNYANQRNYGLTDISYTNDWLLMLDADEVVPDELDEEIKNALNTVESNVCMFRMRRKDHFMGRWLKHSSGYPTWFGRLMRIGRVIIEREINEEYHTDGDVNYLNEHIYHYPFNKGVQEWFEKHNRYSSMEALEYYNKKTDLKTLQTKILNSDPVIRRAGLKQLIYSLPFRPLVMFLSLYFLRRGFLDGRAGFNFCVLRSFYEYMINCKKIELRRRAMGEPL